MSESASDGSEVAGFNVYDRHCSARPVLQHITGRWGILILGALRERNYRFSDLRRRIDGVSGKMLAQTLQTLEHDGFVLREARQDIPPRVEYSLTTQGYEAAELITALISWVEQRMPHILREHYHNDLAIS